MAVVPTGANPAQSTHAWRVWLVQSQLNQYFTVTLFRLKGPVPVLTTRIWGWGLLVVSEVTPLNNCTLKLVVTTTVGVEVAVGGIAVQVAVGGTGVFVEVAVGGTGVKVRVEVRVSVGVGVDVQEEVNVAVGGIGVFVFVDV